MKRREQDRRMLAIEEMERELAGPLRHFQGAVTAMAERELARTRRAALSTEKASGWRLAWVYAWAPAGLLVLLMAVGLAIFCLRYMIPQDRWSDRAAKISFWSLNIGLAWMCFASLFPLGIIQLYHSVRYGYYDARTLQYLTGHLNALIEWLRLPGDTLFIVGGVLPVVYLAWLGVRHVAPRITTQKPEESLYTEIAEMPEVK